MNIITIVFDLNIVEKTAELRSKINLKLPDCVIIATALLEGSKIILTNDSRFKHASSYLDIYGSQEFFQEYLKSI